MIYCHCAATLTQPTAQKDAQNRRASRNVSVTSAMCITMYTSGCTHIQWHVKQAVLCTFTLTLLDSMCQCTALHHVHLGMLDTELTLTLSRMGARSTTSPKRLRSLAVANW